LAWLEYGAVGEVQQYRQVGICWRADDHRGGVQRGDTDTGGDPHGDSCDLKPGGDGPSDPFCQCCGFGEGDVFGDYVEFVTVEASEFA
jgi:hypothetical protein